MAVLQFLSGVDPIIKLVKASTERKKRSELRLLYYRDRQSDDLYSLIRQHWSKPESFRLFQINIVRKIVHKLAMVYRVPPVRQVDGWDQERADELYRDIHANVLLKKANRLSKLCKTVAIQVGWDETEERPTLAVVTPNILDVEYDDPERPWRYVVTHPGERETETQYSDWTETTYRRLDYRGHAISVPGNPQGVNPYGVLPFVPCFDYVPDDQFFLEGGEDLIEAQRAVNVALTNLWRAIEIQSHGQAWIKGATAGDAINLAAGPTSTIVLPENGAFGFAVPGTPIEQVLSAIEFLIRQTAVANDLAANVFDLDDKAESGAAKMYESRDLLEARQDDIDLWRGTESRLFEVIKAVVNTHRPGTIPDSAALYIDFGEITEALSQTERLDSMQRRIDMGIWSPVDALMFDNPDIRTREEAVVELQRRRDEAAQLGMSFAGPRFNLNEAIQ